MDALWLNTPKFGACITCGSSFDEDGFVDLISEVNITRESYNIIGTVDIVLCAKCLTQASRVIGCIPKKESEDLAWKNKELTEKLAEVSDGVTSWQQRYENLLEVMSLIDSKKEIADFNDHTEPESADSSAFDPGVISFGDESPAFSGEVKPSGKRKGSRTSRSSSSPKGV